MHGINFWNSREKINTSTHTHVHMKSYIAHKKITTLAHKLNGKQVLVYPTLYSMETDSNSGYKK
jgi:hypothetical protein